MDRQTLEKELESLQGQSYGWSLRCCFEDRETAAEVLQNTYLKILEGKARFDGSSGFKTWLFSVIRFTAIDYYRKKRRKWVNRTNPENNSQPGTDTRLIAAERRQDRLNLFQRGLAQLSPQQQQILHLVFYQDCTIQEAAAIMGIQLGTARTHYQRGKEQLKKWLTESGALKMVF